MDRLTKRCRMLSQVESRVIPWDVLLGIERTWPDRKPDWRWRLAQRLVRENIEIPADCADRWLLLASRYCRFAASPDTTAKCAGDEFEPIRAAEKLHKTDDFNCHLIQGLLFAKSTISEITALSLEQPETIEAYKALFFDHRQSLTANSCSSLQLQYRP